MQQYSVGIKKIGKDVGLRAPALTPPSPHNGVMGRTAEAHPFGISSNPNH